MAPTENLSCCYNTSPTRVIVPRDKVGARLLRWNDQAILVADLDPEARGLFPR